MDITLIRPTGTCFDDALDFIADMLRASTGESKLKWIESLILVHGICTAPDGRLYAHAWVEHLDESVWQRGVMRGRSVYYQQGRDKFYKDRGVRETTRYTVQEADRMNELHDNFGPWEERYRALAIPR